MAAPSKTPRDAASDLRRRCAELGVPVTNQRLAVFTTLAARDDHPTAEQVFDDLRARTPAISKATAYRTLDKLVELGLVVRVNHPRSVGRYDAKTHRHHHLVCEGCGAVADFESPALDEMRLPDLAPRAFAMRDFSVYVRGLCQHCNRAGRRGEPRAGPTNTPRTRRPATTPSTRPRRKP